MISQWLVLESWRKRYQLSVERNPELLGFCFTPFGIGPEISLLSLHQSDRKGKSIVTRSHAISHTSDGFLFFTMSSHWLFVIFSLLLVGRWDSLGFGFTLRYRNVL